MNIQAILSSSPFQEYIVVDGGDIGKASEEILAVELLYFILSGILVLVLGRTELLNEETARGCSSFLKCYGGE